MMIQMLGTYRGTDDGFTVRRFEEGAFLIVGEDISDTLARHFIGRKQARVVNKDAVNRIIQSPHLNQPI